MARGGLALHVRSTFTLACGWWEPLRIRLQTSGPARLILQAWLPGLGQSCYLATEATVRREGHSFCSHPGAMWVLEPSPFPAMPTPRPSTGTNHTAILPQARWPLTACHLLAASAGLGELGHRACASHTEGTCAQTHFTEQLRALGNLF